MIQKRHSRIENQLGTVAGAILLSPWLALAQEGDVGPNASATAPAKEGVSETAGSGSVPEPLGSPSSSEKTPSNAVPVTTGEPTPSAASPDASTTHSNSALHDTTASNATTQSSESPPKAPLKDSSESRGAPTDMDQLTEASLKEASTGGVQSRYALNLFGDVGAGISGGRNQDTASTFGLGGFFLLFTGELEKSLRFTAEVAFEPRADNSIATDLERLHIRYGKQPSRKPDEIPGMSKSKSSSKSRSGAWIEAGRTHSHLGYWNLAYHHGRWLQPTIDRPRAVHFEDDEGILPIHWIGVQVGYTADLGSDVLLTSSAAIGNGRGSIADDIQNGFDQNPVKQGYGQIELKGLGHKDLRIGVSGVLGTIAAQPRAVRAALPDTQLGEYILGVHFALPSSKWIAIAEGYMIMHTADAQRWVTYDAFAVLGYALPPVTPYVKVERLSMTNGAVDPYFIPSGSAALATDYDVFDAIVGARFDVSRWNCVKVEYRLDHPFAVDAETHTAYASWQVAR